MNGFLSSEYPAVSPEEALFHIIPIPYEGSVSYGGGTGEGPAAILGASDQLEAHDGRGNTPGTRGFFTHPPIDCTGTTEEIFARISAAVESVASLPGRHLPVVLGGEHSVTYPVLRPLVEKYGRGEIGVIHFDAHADLRDRYEGNPLSHASVMRRLHADLGIPLIQVGVRALSQEEIDYRAAHTDTITCYDAAEAVPNRMSRLTLPDRFPKKIFISVDVDGLDPSVMPATGTPVPGGLEWYPLLSMIDSVITQRELIGFDVVELAPIPGLHFAEYTAAELVHKIMGRAVAESS